MKITTLCFLHTNTDILLAMKKVRFGAGKLNGVGGKLDGDETVEEAAIREVMEEIGVSINPDALEKVAIINFTYKAKPEWDQETHVFFTSEWEGEPSESEEMSPEWHSKDNLPFENMWPDDYHWLPKVISGERIMASFNFNPAGELTDDFTIEPLVE